MAPNFPMPKSFCPELTGDPFIDDCRMAVAKMEWVHSEEHSRQIRLYVEALIGSRGNDGFSQPVSGWRKLLNFFGLK